MNHKRARQTIWFITAFLLCFNLTARADYRVLHNFAGGANDGSEPFVGRLIQSGSALYGMTQYGGSSDNGTVFKINIDGSGFQVLHSFSSADTDGINPYGSLLLSGSTLYGMTSCDQTAYTGNIFKLNTDGGGFCVLHQFSGEEGKWPYDSLIQSGSVLYGMTSFGGSSGCGAVFKFNPDEPNFQVLRTFSFRNPNDGSNPYGSLLLSGSTLYGTTGTGGSSDQGAIFRMDTDGANFRLLHSFSTLSSDGRWPYAVTLVKSGSFLFGTTIAGGTSDTGTVFKINVDNNNFTMLHNFTGGSSDGSQPYGSLAQSGLMLYGMTLAGGSSDRGIIFQMDANGSNFHVLHSFTGGDGGWPFGTPILIGSTLYGMTQYGGSYGQGVIFALDVPATCVQPPSGDLNGDCKVDFKDLAILADQWLDCGLEPPSACN